MERLLSIEEMAEILGVKVSTLYAMTHYKKIPFFKLGKLVRFRLSDVESWLQSKMVKPEEKRQSPLENKKVRSKREDTFINRIVNEAV
ncbi:MAG: helix-turn-helix domain-containing protein [Nitrospiraceae bacterium]|nr:helix-turn-helix domain-containing protein [Nitrospiraceae bacterium]